MVHNHLMGPAGFKNQSQLFILGGRAQRSFDQVLKSSTKYAVSLKQGRLLSFSSLKVCARQYACRMVYDRADPVVLAL